MLSAIIEAGQATHDDGERLARTIAAIVPAIADGFVQDGWVIGGEAGGVEEQIADAVGCAWISSPLANALPQAVSGAANPWLLLLGAGSVPESGWWQEAGQFVSRAAVHNPVDPVAATFRLADPRYGFAGRVSEWLAATRQTITGKPLPAQGLIVRADLLAEHLQKQPVDRFPPLLPLRANTLRARIVDER